MTAAAMEILKAPTDHRVYKSLELPNGLKAILIHDPHMSPNSTLHANSNQNGQLHHEEIVDADACDGDDSSQAATETEEDEMTDASEEEESDEHGHVRPHRPRPAHENEGGVKKAAAALSVGVGHFSDPLHLQGLSHYLEHMLFMGSDKYPDENDYDSFLSSNSGSSNACTEEEATTYHFDCAPNALEGALDRFAQFFVSPLIKSDALEREVKAVDNEFSGVLQSDSCRQLQLRAHTAKENHPGHKFGWGNRKSLVEDPRNQGIDVRGELLKHYAEQYSAERMNLVVLGGESLETLESWVNEKFSSVPHGKGPRPRYTECGFPLDDENGGRMAVLPAVRDEHRLTVTFQLPCLEAEYAKKAEDYVSHLIGHEGKGSLLAALKSRGWATELCAGVADQTSAAYLFDVTITLTESGLDAGVGCGMAVIDLLFQYLKMIRSTEPQKWIWDEMCVIGDMKWRFLEEEDAAEYVAQIASDMHVYPIHHILKGSYVYEEFDPILISNLLGQFMTPSKARLDLQTKRYEECKATLVSIAQNHSIHVEKGEEPWFKFPYIMASLPQTFIDTWSDASLPCAPDLSLPSPNPYLPSDFSLQCNSNDGNEIMDPTVETPPSPFPLPPVVIHDVPGLRLWHKIDSTFKIPRTNAYFRVSLPAAYSSPRAAALTHLIVKLLEEALCQEAYLADVADLHYNIWFEGYQGIDIKVDGFSHKLSVLIGLIFNSLAGLQISDDAYDRVHEAAARLYRNANMKPMKHATYLRLRVLKKNLWPIEAIHAELNKVTVTEVRNFLPQLLQDTHLECLVYGNTSKNEAITSAEVARAALGAVSTPTPQDSTICLDTPTSLLVRASVVNKEEENSVVESYFQCGDASNPRSRALLDFVDQVIYEPCYDTLRTKEQLGYTVMSGPRLTHGINGLCIIIQSALHGPAHLDARIDAFLHHFASDVLSSMTDDEFEKNRKALLANKLMKDRNLGEEAEKAWDTLVNRGGDFNAKKNEIEAIKSTTKADVVEYFRTKFSSEGKERRKLAVHIAATAHDLDQGVNGTTLPMHGQQVIPIDTIEDFKQKSQFYKGE